MDISALIDNYRTVIFDRFAKFDGRAGKREFWYFILVNLVVGLVISLLRVPVLSTLYSLAIIVPSLAVSVRRMHDIGKSGWLVALVAIPLIGAIIILVFAAQDGVPGSNQYGNNPEPKSHELAPEASSEPGEPAPMEQPVAQPHAPSFSPAEPPTPQEPASVPEQERPQE